MATTTYRIVLIGFGSVGQGFAQIIRDQGAWIEQRYGVALQLVGVATRSWCTYDPQGIDVATLLDAVAVNTYAALPARQHWAAQELVAYAEANVLVEASSTDLSTGEPATSAIRAALERGLHVVTANKGPTALHGRELQQLARERGLGFGFEATVMSGTPALRLAWSDLAGCNVREARGIINGTTNYILTQMDAGAPYADALAEAQRLGYAETDPTGDVEGHDAAGKALILANMVFGGNLALSDVACTGITALTPDDIAAAQAAGERWKLIARVARDGDQITASVAPQRLSVSHPLASVSGATNAITYTTDLLGDVTLIGPGAGGVATGFALISDLLALPRAAR